jgi:hypothetical protein
MAVAPLILPHLIPDVTKLAEQYLNKQITREELEAGVKKAVLDAFTKISVADAEAIAKTYASAMETIGHNKLMARVWATVVLVELFVLVWHQFGISALLYLTHGKAGDWPSSGATVEWAYLLLAFCLGAGPIVLRAGPGAGGLADKIKSLGK